MPERSIAPALRTDALSVDPHGHRSVGWWGMAATVVTEAALFLYLLFSYFYLAADTRSTWPPDGPPELRLVSGMTALLVASSVTLWWAERGIRRGAPGRLRLGLLATMVLGAGFLVLQFAVEWPRKPFGPTDGAYGSAFYTVTGFHGAHVAIGLLMLGTVTVRAFLGHFDERRHLAVSNVALYWHFVDVVWLAVFTSLYLSPHFA